MDSGSGFVSEMGVLCIRFSGMLNTTGNDSLLHRDANYAAEALMLLLRGRSSSSTKAAYMSLSYCAIDAAFAFASLCNFILGESKMG